MNWMPRIVMPTSDAYMRPCALTIELLKRHWPSHPPVDIVARQHSVEPSQWDNVRSFRAGLQSRVPWTAALRWYLECWNDNELILLLLDDYGLFKSPCLAQISQAAEIMLGDSQVASFHLTNMALPSHVPYRGEEQVICYPPWAYSINLQAAIWRRSHLVELLAEVGSTTAEAFELAGSNIHNTRHHASLYHLSFSTPGDTPLFLDSDPRKAEWVIPYHNLIRRGGWDERHREFCEANGIAGAPLL